MGNLQLNREKRESALSGGNTENASLGTVTESLMGKQPPAEIDGIDYNTAGRVCKEVLGSLNSEYRDRKLSSLRLDRVYGELDRMVGGGKLSNGVSPGKRQVRVHSCSTYFEFASATDGSGLHLHKANFCKDRLCPQCNKRRSLKIFGQTSQIMDVLDTDPAGYQYIFLTLTLRNCPSPQLADTLNLFQIGWRWLYHDTSLFRPRKGRHSRSEALICGSFRSLEVKLARDGRSWHPHLHIILAVRPDYFTGPDYLETRDWVKLWRRACGLDYDPICYVEAVKPNSAGEYRDAVAEVSKYPVKGYDYLMQDSLDLSVSRVLPLLLSLTGRRLCSYTGCFAKARKQLQLDDPIDGDLVNVDGQQLRPDVSQVIYRFGWQCGCYVFLPASDSVRADPRGCD